MNQRVKDWEGTIASESLREKRRRKRAVRATACQLDLFDAKFELNFYKQGRVWKRRK